MRRLAFLLLSIAACSGGKKSEPTVAQPPAASNAELPIGGMWLPEQLPEHAAALRAHGLRISPEALSNPLEAPLGAIVQVPGCSASFVSDEGLIITNHHCAQGALAYHSAGLKRDLVSSGYLAKSRSEELWNGPTGRVYITDEIIDVTKDVRDGLQAIEDLQERYAEYERRKKELVAKCEGQRPNHRCSVSSYFGGAEYRLIAKLEIRDLRLVYAPAGSIGAYGGDIDNWMWPRHY